MAAPAPSVNALRAAHATLKEMMRMPGRNADSVVTDAQLDAVLLVVPVLRGSPREIQRALLWNVYSFINNPHTETPFSDEVLPSVIRFILQNRPFERPSPPSPNNAAAPAPSADALRAAYATLNAVMRMPNRNADSAATDAQLDAFLRVVPVLRGSPREIQRAQLWHMYSFINSPSGETQLRDEVLPFVFGFILHNTRRERPGAQVSDDEDAEVGGFVPDPNMAPLRGGEDEDERALEDVRHDYMERARGIVERFHGNGADLPSAERDLAIHSEAMRLDDQYARRRFIDVVLEIAPHWIDIKQHIVGVVTDRSLFLATIYAWRQTRRGALAVPREHLAPIIAAIPTPEWRLGALVLLMDMEDLSGEIDEPPRTYALVNWPCVADVHFIGGLMDLLLPSGIAVQFAGSVIRQLVPPPNHDDICTYETFHQLYRPLIARMDTRTERFLLSCVIIDSMSLIGPVVYDAFMNLMQQGRPIPNRRDDDRLHMAIQMHNHAVRGAASREAVGRMRTLALAPAGGGVDEKLATEEDPATRQHVVKKELEAIACIACHENKRAVCFVPCGHAVCCHACAARIDGPEKKCPICRAKIKTAQPCFL